MPKSSTNRIPAFDYEKCMACTICIEICPVGCLAQLPGRAKDPHPYPFLAERKACISCASCEQECPVEAVSMVEAK
jgi:formate hydrogenlyase subunit 6/NADH:ubiquinone oxidoreductase subunit I